MIYYVVRVQTPDQACSALVFALDSRQNLMDQVIAKLGPNIRILDIRVMNWEWDQILKETPCDSSSQGGSSF